MHGVLIAIFANVFMIQIIGYFILITNITFLKHVVSLDDNKGRYFNRPLFYHTLDFQSFNS